MSVCVWVDVEAGGCRRWDLTETWAKVKTRSGATNVSNDARELLNIGSTPLILEITIVVLLVLAALPQHMAVSLRLTVKEIKNSGEAMPAIFEAEA